LYWAAVVNGVISAPIMAVMMLMSANPKVMGELVSWYALEGAWLGCDRRHGDCRKFHVIATLVLMIIEMAPKLKKRIEWCRRRVVVRASTDGHSQSMTITSQVLVRRTSLKKHQQSGPRKECRQQQVQV
jgi:hypothetical protein